MTTFFPVFYIVALTIFAIAMAVTDTVWRKIPNVWTAPFAVLGLIFSVALWCVQYFGAAVPLDVSAKELALMRGCDWNVMFTYLTQITPLWAIAGFFLGFFILFLGFVIGGVGAGDLKLLAALGIWLGVKWFLLVFCISILLAAFLSVCAIIAQGPVRMMRKLRNMKKIGSKDEPSDYTPKSAKDKKRRNRSNPKELKRIIPFAIPVALGVGIFLILFVTNTFQNIPVFYK